MTAFLASPSAPGRDDYSHLLSSPLQQPWALFASPAPAVQEGRLSFDVLTSPGAVADDAIFKARSVSHLELFALTGSERAKAGDATAAPAPQQQQQELQAALTEKVVAKVVEAKQAEVGELVAGVAAKYGLAADYGKVEETIEAVWAEQSTHTSWAYLAANARPRAAAMTAAAATMAPAEEPTLGKVSGDNTSCNEEAAQQATSMPKEAADQVARADSGNASLKRPLATQPSFSFPVPSQHAAAVAAATDDAALKRRRVQYDRMRELEAHVQRVCHLGDALSQSLRQAESQHTAITTENEQLWNALLHIHASLRAAHAAQLRQQVAMHAGVVAAVLPAPAPLQESTVPTPNTFFGGLFSPDADELAAACGMFISPTKLSHAVCTANKPRKLFLEEGGRMASGERPVLPIGDLPGDLSPALWVQAA